MKYFFGSIRLGNIYTDNVSAYALKLSWVYLRNGDCITSQIKPNFNYITIFIPIGLFTHLVKGKLNKHLLKQFDNGKRGKLVFDICAQSILVITCYNVMSLKHDKRDNKYIYESNPIFDIWKLDNVNKHRQWIQK